MIRVLRVIEYEYPNHRAYEEDKVRWTNAISSPRNSTHMTSQVVRVQEVEQQAGRTTVVTLLPDVCKPNYEAIVHTEGDQVLKVERTFTSPHTTDPESSLPQLHQA